MWVYMLQNIDKRKCMRVYIIELVYKQTLVRVWNMCEKNKQHKQRHHHHHTPLQRWRYYTNENKCAIQLCWWIRSMYAMTFIQWWVYIYIVLHVKTKFNKNKYMLDIQTKLINERFFIWKFQTFFFLYIFIFRKKY